ncbi:4862_t:CDS:2 [Acaulospora colombiana]|uniref:4862_t:CDS:1 n=1 Tax=Acaulospora colombiana TaxID=27376 RepID=A0ACA9KCU4_9GLOM|nr:4862_t:CDS:2 [Acaulospora colombiana]
MSHLAWIPTVVPMADFDERFRKNLFYDPLWAQLSDLYGSIGASSIMSRTIVIGSDANTVRRILFLLSYFIRCNEVDENIEDMTPSDGLNLGRKKSLGKSERNQRNTSAQNSEAKDSLSQAASEVSCFNETDGQAKGWNVNEDKSQTETYFYKRKSSTENRRSLIIDSPFTEISVDNFLDVPMPKSQPSIMIPDPSLSKESVSSPTETPHRADQLFVKSYGRSLMVGYCDTYMPDFVLMGLPKYDFQDSLETDLKESLQVTVFGYDREIPHAGDSSFTVQGGHIRNGNRYFIPIRSSKYIRTMLHQCTELYTKTNMPAESCLEYIEDQLRILCYKAVSYRKFASGTSPSISSVSMFSPSKVEEAPLDILEALELHESDMELVDAIGSTFQL